VEFPFLPFSIGSSFLGRQRKPDLNGVYMNIGKILKTETSLQIMKSPKSMIQIH